MELVLPSRKPAAESLGIRTALSEEGIKRELVEGSKVKRLGIKQAPGTDGEDLRKRQAEQRLDVSGRDVIGEGTEAGRDRDVVLGSRA